MSTLFSGFASHMRRQRGLGLPELLVASAIGALLLLMGTVMLVSANSAFTAHADVAAIDDAGRFAVDLVGRAVRQAAFADFERVSADDEANGPPQVLGLDAMTVPRSSPGLDGATADAINGSDVLALRFSGAHGGAVDCGGFAIEPGEDGWSIFHVGRNAAGDGELRCKYRGGSGWGSDAIVDGVDSFQVLYGVDTDEPPDGVPNEYISASALTARDGALDLDGVDESARQRELLRRTLWKRVTAVRIALLLHGGGGGVRSAAVYDLFGASYSAHFSAADAGVHIDEAPMIAALRQRERRLFSASIMLRNGARSVP
jgi:type IV pilus assembly protein PilW